MLAAFVRWYRYRHTRCGAVEFPILHQPINQTTLQKILDHLDWRAPDGARLAEIMAKPLRERFLADGLVTQEKNLLQCHPDIVEVLTRRAVAAGVFEFDGLSPALRFQGLAFLLSETSAYLHGSRDAWRLMTDYFGAHPPHQEVAFFLAEQWLYRGEPGQAEALLPDDSHHSLSLLGWARFIQGRYEDAIGHFEAALKAERRKTRKRNIHIPGLAGVCFVLALQRSEDPSHRELARKQLLTAQKATAGDLFDSIFRLLDDLLSILEGTIRAEQSVWLRRDSLAIEPWLDLFRCLTLHWVEEKPSPHQLAHLLKYCNSAREANLSWYAREAALLLRKAGKRDTCAEAAVEAEQRKWGQTRYLEEKRN